MRTLTLFLALPLFASAQSLSIGFLGGAPFQDVVKSTTTTGVTSVAKSSNFTAGPSLQVSLPKGFRIEVDALFRPYSFGLVRALTNPVPGAVSSGAVDVSAQQWRFPLLAQYRIGKSRIQPFIEGGLSFDRLSGLTSALKSTISSGPGQLLHQSNASVVLGAGLDVKIPLLRFSGEIRFTRPTVSNFANISNLNQAEVLVGIHF
jgi:Outer membrane protein beta-barrel domain